ncbi:NAD(P)-dependent alcohol dehydrogenase [Streptomyces sp. YIM 98790]|uniref:NAD(P)-dependent alcohol dehydrogenase n=1 Tax=Streptomyces sp. YIM 98790 TaxID=2689077 RepID=UPI0028BED266|nr:NAD(P)-dependent alcohol dehydrogenase [Streptomyces sp. YIM 98790]
MNPTDGPEPAEAAPHSAGDTTMKAWTWDRYGSPDVLRLRLTTVPRPGPGEVLVRVRAGSVNPYDWRHLRADPALVRLSAGLRRPRPGLVLGADLAGVVDSVGSGVTGFRPGDEVFGEVTLGAFAEAVAVPAATLAAKPAGISFAEAAALPMAGLTALQGLRDAGRLTAGQRVLITGAAGGVGTFAVQLAKVWGAEVTAVASPDAAGLLRSLGADEVIDRTREDFTDRGPRWDLLLDNVGDRPPARCRRALAPGGTLVMVGGISGHGGRLLGPATQVLRGMLAGRFVRRHRITAVRMRPGAEDLALLAGLADDKRVVPVIDRGYGFGELPEALRHLERRHARGKVVLTL